MQKISPPPKKKLTRDLSRWVFDHLPISSEGLLLESKVNAQTVPFP